MHGSMQKVGDQPRMREIFLAVINALRLTILTYIALRSSMDKKKFINAIDDALIDYKNRKQLEELISNSALLKLC